MQVRAASTVPGEGGKGGKMPGGTDTAGVVGGGGGVATV